jgi:hypothetical protein
VEHWRVMADLKMNSNKIFREEYNKKPRVCYIFLFLLAIRSVLKSISDSIIALVEPKGE